MIREMEMSKMMLTPNDRQSNSHLFKTGEESDVIDTYKDSCTRGAKHTDSMRTSTVFEELDADGLM